MSKLNSLLVFLGLSTLFGCASPKPVKTPAAKQPPRCDVKIRQAVLDKNDYNCRYKFGPEFKQVDYITIHNTYNFGPATAERAYLNKRRDKKYISFHFAVDETEALQILPLEIRGWHAGDKSGPGNSQSIGIEICRSRCTGKKEPLYRQSEENGARLAAKLLDQYNLPISALRKHQDWSGKYCPHRILSEKRWEEFKDRVKQIREINRNANCAAPTDTP